MALPEFLVIPLLKEEWSSLPAARVRGDKILLPYTTGALFNCVKAGVPKDLLPSELLKQASREIKAHKNKYNYPAGDKQLRPYQRAAVEWLKVFKRGLLAFAMGAGKTRTALVLGKETRCQKVLILCPISAFSAWEKELQEIDLGIEAYFLKDLKQKSVEYLVDILNRDKFIVITNYEKVFRDKVKKYFLKKFYDLIVLDEGHAIQNSGSKISKFCYRLRSSYRVILTGTPKGRSYLAYFGMYKFLDHGVFGTNKELFKARYSISNPNNKYHIVKWINTEELLRKVHYLCFRVSKEEALPFLPEVNEQIIELELPSKIMKKYIELEKKSVTEIGDELIGAINIVSKLNKLNQFASGFVYEDKKVIEVHDIKLKALLEFIKSFDDSHLIVFYWYKEDRKRIKEMLEKHNVQYYEYCSHKYQEKEWAKNGGVLLAQMKSASLGIDLTAANTIVYYSLYWDSRVFAQSKDRIHRPPQRKTCFYYYLQVKDTIDEKILEVVKDSESTNKEELDIYKKICCKYKKNIDK